MKLRLKKSFQFSDMALVSRPGKFVRNSEDN